MLDSQASNLDKEERPEVMLLAACPSLPLASFLLFELTIWFDGRRCRFIWFQICLLGLCYQSTSGSDCLHGRIECYIFFRCLVPQVLKNLLSDFQQHSLEQFQLHNWLIRFLHRVSGFYELDSETESIRTFSFSTSIFQLWKCKMQCTPVFKICKVLKTVHPQVLSLLPNYDGKAVLELGAGIGRFTGELALKAGHVIALDFIENAIKKVRLKIHFISCQNVTFGIFLHVTVLYLLTLMF